MNGHGAGAPVQSQGREETGNAEHVVEMGMRQQQPIQPPEPGPAPEQLALSNPHRNLPESFRCRLRREGSDGCGPPTERLPTSREKSGRTPWSHPRRPRFKVSWPVRAWDRRGDAKGNMDSNSLQSIQLGFVLENAATRPIRHQHLAIGNMPSRRAQKFALTSGIRCEDISIPCVAAMPGACIQPVTPPIRATSGMTKSLALAATQTRTYAASSSTDSFASSRF